MKRLLALLALIMLLAGCATEDPAQTTAPQASLSTRPSGEVQPPVTEDPGLYDADNQVEAATGGAVCAYPLKDANGMGIVPMGEDILLISVSEAGTNLTLLTGDRCTVKASAAVSGTVYPGSGSLRVCADQVVFYDAQTHSVVFLNGFLKETECVVLPEEVQGEPVIGSDLKTVYYCTADRINVLDLDTGISRLLRQQVCQWQTVQQVMFDDTVLECHVTDHGGDFYTCYLSTDTGEILGRDEAMRSLEVWGDRYILRRAEGFLDEILFGTAGGEACCFTQNSGESIFGLPSINGVLGMRMQDMGSSLAYYDLESGRQTASVTLPGGVNVYSVAADASGTYVWLLAYDSAAGQDILYRWELAESAVVSDTVYTGQRYTADAPDTEGLAVLQGQADTLGEKYGVQIVLGDAVTQPGDYTLTHEYRVPAFQYALEELERALSAYPEGFLEMAVERTSTGVLRIGLVRDISDGVTGLQYWLNGDAYIAVKIGTDLEQTMYHEVCHLMDNFIIANSYAYDDWEELCPQGFAYDYNYEDHKLRESSKYLEGEDRAFIDSYSMSYPKEDRARILEYAMMPGNEALFDSVYMQKKLLQICNGIRECFGLEKSAETYRWEQYLETSLAYVK